jgi:uncharacterized membrane protein YfcA
MEPTDQQWWESIEDPPPSVGCAPWLLNFGLTVGTLFAYVTSEDGTTYPTASSALMVVSMWSLVLVVSRYWWKGNRRESAKALLIGMAILTMLFGYCVAQSN